MMNHTDLIDDVEALYAAPKRSSAALDLLAAVRCGLGDGTIRVASPEPAGGEGEPGKWTVHPWVKKAMLLMSSLGTLTQNRPPYGSSSTELDTLPWRQTPPPSCRVPEGYAIREGAFLGTGVTCLPPAVIQLGAYVGERTVIDSMVSIGAGVQIGTRAQLSCRSTIGGWVLPVDQLPTIIEDEALVGTGSGIYDGAQIGRGAVLLAGTQILPSLGIYDLGTESMLVRAKGEPLRVPPRAIVAMGSRPVGTGGAHVQMPIIVGQRRGPRIQDWEMYMDLSLQL